MLYSRCFVAACKQTMPSEMERRLPSVLFQGATRVMSCARREYLERKTDQAGMKLDLARQRLRERIGICTKEEFLTLSDDLDRASELLDSTTQALDNHIRRHCCLTHDSASVSPQDY